jgi:hypothetical protein
MAAALTEKFLAKLLGFTGAFTTIFLISGSVTDPVNTPKMVAIGVLGTSAIAVVFFTKLRVHILQYRFVLLVSILFFIFMCISSVSSTAPFTQVLYGSYGRNNGLLTYSFLIFLLIASLTIQNVNNFKYIVLGLVAAGLVNIIYCLWVVIFGDFISWDNPYKRILGTLGNPNFIGAFLGIVFTTGLALVLDKNLAKLFRVVALATLPISTFEILESNAIQGRVVAAFGSVIVLFLYIRSKFNIAVLAGFSIFSITAGILALAGALQMGPLSDYIYKTSVSLRGQYWLAGWNTGMENPFTGVGMDTFGDWYRRMRDAHALELPGVNTVVNAAHNVPIDIFAFGGWPLFIAYLALMGWAGISLLKTIARKKDFDLILAVLASSWAGYQLQSIISINQIGLAVWGWILSGAVIAYEKATLILTPSNDGNMSDKNKIKAKTKTSLPAQVPLYATIGGIIGLLIALPPLTADSKWQSASRARTLPALEETMQISYFNPPNSMKFLRNIQNLEQSNLFDLSRKYALEAVKWNPDNFDSWKVLYLIRNSTLAEKEEALKNMKRLDPLNPDVTSTQ